jgi:hypothetical protein
MINRLRWWTMAALAGVALVALSALPVLSADTGGREAPARVTRIDFENSEPFQVRAKVMEVKPEKGTFVVAEREICEMDVISADGRLHTTYYDLAGKSEEKHSYRVGQYVSVKGYLLPEGYVAAVEVRVIEKPQEKRVPYKPIANQGKGSHPGSRGSGEQP